MSRSVARAPRAGALTSAGEEILRAVAQVVLGPLLPADPPARARALDDAMWAVDDYLAHLSGPLQREARVPFAVLHSLPARAVLLRTRRAWRDAPPARVEAFLRSARGSPLLLLRRIYDFLHAMTVIAWFDLPVAWDEIGYPGPPVERPLRRGGEP
ncbi:MAG: hypothetical protein IT372_30665 [Polyangiaceae bacterium]|nr:hypothetical protein [Polyangiaceae bacterium]